MLVTSRDNIERTGKRHVTRLSTTARTVGNVRHLDADLIQYCPRCRAPQIFFEVKSAVIPDQEWSVMRMLADKWQCMAMLVIERKDGGNGVKVYTSADKLIHPLRWGDDGYLVTLMEYARDKHECRRG